MAVTTAPRVEYFGNMSLTILKQLIKRYWPLVAIVFILLSGYLIIYLHARPQQKTIPKILPPPAIPKNPLQKPPGRYDLSNVKAVPLPTSLPAYSIETTNLDLSAAQNIASSFSFNGKPTRVINNTTDGTQFEWQDKTKLLSISQTTIRFEDTSIPTNEATTSASLTESDLQKKAIDIARSVLKQESGLVLNNSKTAYLVHKNKLLESASTFSDAQIVQFSFDKNLSSYPLYSANINPSYAIITVSKDGQLAQFYSRLIRATPKGNTYQIKTLPEAEAAVENGMGIIVNTYIPDKNGLALNLYSVGPQEITLARITNVSLAYFMPSNPQNDIQPIFVFSGDFSTNNQKGKIVIYLPAIQSSQP